MPQSLAQVYLHIVFSTKNRIPYLKEKELRDRLHAYLAGICKNLDCPAQIVGGFITAALSNPFRVDVEGFRTPRVRCATLGFVVEPLRGSDRAFGAF